MKAGLDFAFRFAGSRGAARQRPEGEPFRLLLVGDFSGRAAALARGERRELGRPVPVDAEHVDKALARFAAELTLASGGSEQRVAFSSLEDLHPDRLVNQFPRLSRGSGLREAISGSSPSETALREATRFLEELRGAPPSGAGEGGDATLERLLGRPAPESSQPDTAVGLLDQILEKAVAPHVRRDVSAERGRLLPELDAALGADVAALLASPSFSSLEATWRGAAAVVAALDTDEDLQIAFFDATLADLEAATQGSGGDLEASVLHRAWLGGDVHWSVIALDFAFGATPEELALVATLTALAARSGAVLLADAAPALFGCWTPAAAAALAPGRLPPVGPELAAFWQELRRSPLAPYLGLTFPRVLLRQPYGKKTDAIDAFAFEELDRGREFSEQHRLWGSGAFALARLLGRGFRERGWDLEPDAALEVDDLPAHTATVDGAERLAPCAEVALGERAASALGGAGVMAWLARADRAAVRLARTASVADPPAPLAGAWCAES